MIDIIGIVIGYCDLDYMIIGFYEEELIILAVCLVVGKIVFVLNIV